MINTVYSHSEYFDVLEIFLDQWQTYYGEDILILADKKYKDKKTILYNDKLSYSEKLLSCIDAIDNEIIFFQHEDMFLYDYPNINLLNSYRDILLSQEKDFIRLIKSPGNYDFANSKIKKTLFDIPKEASYIFTAQPTIWKKKSLQKFLHNSGKLNIWQLEENSSFINENVKLSGLYHFNNESKRGGHYDSDVWPYTASSTIQGKWNFIEYKKELTKIQKILDSKRNFLQ